MYTVKVTQANGLIRYYKADSYADAAALCEWLNETDAPVSAEIL